MTRAHAYVGPDSRGSDPYVALTLGAMTPLHSASREHIFRDSQGHVGAPHGGLKRSRSFRPHPSDAGLRDILVLKNQDEVPQIFGPTLMMPGQSFRLPFDRPAQYQFACTAHASGQMTIVVEHTRARLWRESRARAGTGARALIALPFHLRVSDI